MHGSRVPSSHGQPGRGQRLKALWKEFLGLTSTGSVWDTRYSNHHECPEALTVASQHQSRGYRLASILGQILRKGLHETQPEYTVTLGLSTYR